MIGYAGKMVLPFLPLSIAFKDVQYFVDTPPVIFITMLLLSCDYVYCWQGCQLRNLNVLLSRRWKNMVRTRKIYNCSAISRELLGQES
jgi:hypothetical protein